MLPNPTAAPVAASRNADREDQDSWTEANAIVFSVGILRALIKSGMRANVQLRWWKTSDQQFPPLLQGMKQMIDVRLIIIKVRGDAQIAIAAGNDNVILRQTGYQAIVIAGTDGDHRRMFRRIER
jgi:hypothetical protein